MKKLFFIIIISLIYVSCEKIIPFEGDITIPKLVINSIFESDSSFKVHVSSSRSVIDTASFKNINDAVVSIKNENGNIIETLSHSQNGFYVGQKKPVENQIYNLEVDHLNYTNISASDSLPIPISINYLDTITVIEPNNENRLQINLNFTDPANSQNFYLVETYVVRASLLITINQDTLEYELDTIRQRMILSDVVFQNNGFKSRDEQGLFTDLLFNGQDKNLEIKIPPLKKDYVFEENGKFYSEKTLSLALYLHNISKSYYYYRTSLELYVDASRNPFSQPVQVFSNINNGFGIFAGAQISYFAL
tara:strand:+ start:1042 stop:1959 length:918 start_codon:yes stop_codon:yes gene_type:complete